MLVNENDNRLSDKEIIIESRIGSACLSRAITITAARTRLIPVSARTDWLHVLLETDAGMTGIGEASLNPLPDGFVDGLTRGCAALVGRCLDGETLAPLAPLLQQGFGARTIHSALDQAIADLSAQRAGVPLYQFLASGAVRSPIPLYANINRTTTDRSADGFAASAARAVGQGHTSLKIAAFDDLAPGLCGTSEGQRLIEAGLSRLRAVARDGVELRVDCHWRFTSDAAHDILPGLAKIGVAWLECPLPETPDAITDLRRLRDRANRLGIRTAGLETFAGWEDVAPFVEGGAYDVIMPDVKHAGGLGRILEIADRAARLGVAVSLHNPSGPVAHLFSTHVAIAMGGDERMEIQWDESPDFFRITDPAPRIEGDRCLVTDTPGLGAKLVKQPAD